MKSTPTSYKYGFRGSPQKFYKLKGTKKQKIKSLRCIKMECCESFFNNISISTWVFKMWFFLLGKINTFYRRVLADLNSVFNRWAATKNKYVFISQNESRSWMFPWQRTAQPIVTKNTKAGWFCLILYPRGSGGETLAHTNPDDWMLKKAEGAVTQRPLNHNLNLKKARVMKRNRIYMRCTGTQTLLWLCNETLAITVRLKLHSNAPKAVYNTFF